MVLWTVVRGRLWIVEVEGDSMAPTLCAGDLVLCEHDPPRDRLAVGDVVVMRGADPSRGLAIKRLAGLPGVPLAVTDLGEGVVAQGQCLVLGDNSEIQGDSRRFGPQPMESIVGRVIWPNVRERRAP